MKSASLEKWETKLKKMLDEIDDLLEEKYGKRFKLHPARAKKGITANKASDGLFNIKSSFTMGYGSKLGKGYVLDIIICTLETVPIKLKKEIKDVVYSTLRIKIKENFTDQKLEIKEDGGNLKVVGDLSF